MNTELLIGVLVVNIGILALFYLIHKTLLQPCRLLVFVDGLVPLGTEECLAIELPGQ